MKALLPFAHAASPLTDAAGEHGPIILSSRLRLARNLAHHRFPAQADAKERQAILQTIFAGLPKRFQVVLSESMRKEERLFFVERHLASREFANISDGAAIAFDERQSLSLLLNEEDHLRLQCLRNGLHLEDAYDQLDQLDDDLSRRLPIAFDSQLGYLTACPTNLGTGLRASVMLHLPALLMADKVPQVVKAVHSIGCVVRGLFGEGSNPDGCFFQISNQQTLGESEQAIMKRLHGLIETVVEAEWETRRALQSQSITAVLDRLSRSFALLQNAYRMGTAEAIALLSSARLAADLNLLPPESRGAIDRLLIELQPIHLQVLAGKPMEDVQAEIVRAEIMRRTFKPYTLDIGSIA